MVRFRKSWLALFLVVAALVATASAADEIKNFITRRGDQLFDGDQPYRFISWNIPNLMVQEDAYEFTKPNPWRWPDEFEIEDALESVRQMGGQVVRTYVLSVYREGSDMGERVHVRRPGEFNEEGFRALDKVLQVARQKNIRVIIPFVDHSKWWGGIAEYAAFRGKSVEAFWTDPQIIDDFKATIRHLLTRKNTYTGVEYRDDPTILGWETGNEILPPPEWTAEIAAYIKQLDAKHLVIDGKSLKGVPLKSLDDPNVDVITTHHYPFGDDHDFSKEIHDSHALTKGKKAYFVGEFGFVEMPNLASAIQTAIDEGTSGALLWSLRMHRREGGFYWHMETGTGKNIYKAFHWPGFASGDRYDEKLLMPLVRNKAYEIRGLDPPPLERPAPPKLLPIERVSAITWQGSAGASTYDVWRAPAVKGPWAKIAENVSDADVQYRPLFHDDTAIPGQQYWYRIVARNSAGDSEPSNITGPVTAACRTLVDECRDLSLTAATEGDVTSASDNARTVQEDCHRLALASGAAVTYRVDKPISQFTIYAFGPGDAVLTIETSTDGKKFEPTKVERQAFSSGQTVYGYSTPILFTGTAAEDAAYLRISLRKSTTGEKAKSAVVELSRIEIEYAHAAISAPKTKPQTKKAAQLNSAIFVDVGRPVTEALAAIDAAAARGERRLNVVVTILVDLSKDLKIKSFGGNDANGDYTPFDDAMRNEMQAKLRQIFTRMVKHHMDITILPHIDAGAGTRTWRNWVDFDPLTVYGGYSYNNLLLDTIASALTATVNHDTEIDFALSGEMGTSLFRYPQSYRMIVAQLRAHPELKHLKIGISLNHGGIAGRGNPVGPKEIELTEEQREQMQALIEDCDFVGMSFYAPVSATPTVDDFVRGIDRFMGEFQQLGLSVPTSKPMQFSEVGIGGRQLINSAGDPAKAVQTPWEGTAETDKNPWKDPQMRKLRRQFHDSLLQFLTEQPARWQVECAFVWSMGSWDPVGARDPEFADAEIKAAIERHNRVTQ